MVEMIVPASTETARKPYKMNIRRILSCGSSIGFSSGRTKVCNPIVTIQIYSMIAKKAVQNKNCILPLRINMAYSFSTFCWYTPASHLHSDHLTMKKDDYEIKV